MSELIRVIPIEKSSRIWNLELNRSEKLNAFSVEMLSDFKIALTKAHSMIAKNELSVLIISSSAAPKAFCAGADLSERLTMNEKKVSEVLTLLRSVMDGVAALECATIAVIDGIAFGGGLELGLACDLRVFSDKALVGLTETRLAIIPGAGGTQRLTRLIGPAKTKEMIFCGRKLNSSEALTFGIANKISDNAFEAALEMAKEISKGGPLSIKAAKAAIDGGMAMDLKSSLDWERSCYERVLKSKDRVEGLKAFVEKRNPNYLGE